MKIKQNTEMNGREKTAEVRRNRKAEAAEVRKKWKERWESGSTGTWTKEVITDLDRWLDRKHGHVDYYTTQMMTGHGAFGAYLHRFKKRPSPHCEYCPQRPVDDVTHTLVECPRWDEYRRDTDGRSFLPSTLNRMGDDMAKSAEIWRKTAKVTKAILTAKEDADRLKGW